MKTISLKDWRQNMRDYITATQEKGEVFTVTDRNKPAFKVVPFDWDDEPGWETVVDFTKDYEGGMPIDDFLKMMKEIRKETDTKQNG